MAQTKEEKAAYMAVYRVKNREAIAAQRQQHRIETKEERAAYMAGWRDENRERVAEYSEENKTTPKRRFTEHKSNAKRDGKEFLLTFAEWWAIWEPHWEGRGNGRLVMCRTGDVGPYAVGNVRIDTQANNSKERHSGKIDKQDTT